MTRLVFGMIGASDVEDLSDSDTAFSDPEFSEPSEPEQAIRLSIRIMKHSKDRRESIPLLNSSRWGFISLFIMIS